MKFSEQWLREWVNPNVDTQTLLAQLTNAGLEVDKAIPVAGDFTNVMVGEILSIKPHPDADRLKVCQVKLGEKEIVQVVTNLSDIAIGVKTAVAMIGAVLPDGLTIKKSKLRGVLSEGMFCGKETLGLIDAGGPVMIWQLPKDAPIGISITDYLQLDDAVIEVELTANRGDCLSILGIAREVAVANKCNYKAVIFSPVPASIDDRFSIKITAEKACPRYLGRVIRGINSTIETPIEIQEKLRRSGVRCIHPVVDIGNYVMLELGQPMHAFDLAKLEGGIHVRQAKPDERLALLDGQEVELRKDTLVIADENTVLAMAGVMGGENSAVTEKSSDIFLESAFFDPILLMDKARHYGLRTDSSHRFERGVDPELTRKAMERATQLLLDIVGGQAGPIEEQCCEDYLPKREPILLRAQKVNRLLGCDIAPDKMIDILQRLELTVSAQGEGQWEVHVPSYRFDIAIESDLIEEIARIYGYNNIPTHMPQAGLAMLAQPSDELSVYALRRVLQTRDYQEAICYSFVSEKSEKLLSPAHVPYPLANPISPELSVMRSSLWSGLLVALQRNLKRQEVRVRLFEIGLRFVQTNDGLAQIPSLAGIACGPHLSEQWGEPSRPLDYYDIKSDVEALLALGHQEQNISFKAADIPALHPGRSARIERDREGIGYLGALHPHIRQQWGLPDVYLFEFDLNALQKMSVPKHQSVSKFPSVRRDISVLLYEDMSAEALMHTIWQSAGNLLGKLLLFDVYRGEGVPTGQKSLALGLIWQHAERTLTDEEINAAMDKIIQQLANKHQASLRE